MPTARAKNLLVVWIIVMAFVLSCSTVTNALAPTERTTVVPTLAQSPTAPAASTGPAAGPPPELGYHSAWGKSQIAFASNRTGSFQIFLMKPDGSALLQLTDSKGDNTAPAWSPDGKQLFFVSARDGNSEIYSMNPDGTAQTNITEDPHDDSLPVALPNKRIAFVSDRLGERHIFMMNDDGTNVQAFQNTSIGADTRILCLVWYTDADVFFTTEENSQRVTSVLDISNGDVWVPQPFAGQPDHSCPSISILRNSDWVMFVTNRDGHDEIYGFRESNETDIRFTQESEPSTGLSRSADQSWVTFYSKRSGNWDIFVMGIQGKYQWNITNNPADDIDPAWQPY